MPSAATAQVPVRGAEPSPLLVAPAPPLGGPPDGAPPDELGGVAPNVEYGIGDVGAVMCWVEPQWSKVHV